MIRLIDKIPATPSPPNATLTLPWEKRIKSRLRVVLNNGEEAGLFLPRGMMLRDKELLVAENGLTVEVLAALETVSILNCSDSLFMARVCYHLGNRHTPLQIMPGQARYLQDHVLDAMVKGLGLEVEVGLMPFEPEIGAYGQAVHHHGK